MCIIICSSGEESSLFEEIKKHRHIFEGDMFSDNPTADTSPLTLLHTRQPCEVLVPTHISVYPKGIYSMAEAEKSCLASVINSDFGKCSDESCCQKIKCGLSTDDTLTFSSFTDTTAVVSLQGSIKTAAGRLAESCEIPIEIKSGISKFDILALCALLFLCDRGDCIGSMVF